MKKTLFIVMWLATLNTSVSRAQPMPREPIRPVRMSRPFMVSVQFQSLALPFQDMPKLFSNVGIALGTEYMYNRRGNLIQTFQGGFYRNRYAGDGLYAFTQVSYRPHVGPVYAEVKAGMGWNYTFHLNTIHKLRDGQWSTNGRTGKGLLMVPLGLSVGYAGKSLISPLVGYQSLYCRAITRHFL